MDLTEAKLLENNEDNFDRLMAVIEASLGMLALLIVSCEQRAFREEIIERYETELSPEIGCYRVQLDQQEPSLRAALAALVEQNAGLDQAQMVVTVTGIGELIDIRLKNNEEKSPLERFFGYLQWTREGLRAFPFPIILWVTPTILKRMSLAAPDFWSWRTGVFRFVGTETVEVEADKDDLQIIFVDREGDINQTLPIAELEKQISQIQAQNVNSPVLATLYDRLGEAYRDQIRLGRSKNLQVDINQAIASFQQAIQLQRRLNLKSDLGNSLIRLGHLYYDLSQYQKAEISYQQALEITREIGDEQTEADSLNNLGLVYQSLGQYQMAIALHQQCLDIVREIGHKQDEAASLGNLGNAYEALGEYQQAITFQQKSLEITREIGDKQGEAASLGNLGVAYNSLGEYQQAITFHQQSLETKRAISDRRGEANSLGNLGIAYDALGEHERAITFHQQQLDIAREIRDRRGEASSLCGLGIAYQALGEYQQAIAFYQQQLEIAREIGDRRGEATAWFNLGLTLKELQREAGALGAFRNARQLYQAMELESKVQDCNNQINSLYAPISPSSPSTPWQKIRQILRRFWRWLSHLFH